MIQLLARRVTDSHERTAAVELVALHQELAKLGFTRKEQKHPDNCTPASPDATFRDTALSPVQRAAQVVRDMRRWLGLRPANGRQ